jgi:hypothetical protein
MWYNTLRRSGASVAAWIDSRGAVAQLGERLNRTQEVEGSIPFGSTTQMLSLTLGISSVRL